VRDAGFRDEFGERFSWEGEAPAEPALRVGLGGSLALPVPSHGSSVNPLILIRPAATFSQGNIIPG